MLSSLKVELTAVCCTASTSLYSSYSATVSFSGFYDITTSICSGASIPIYRWQKCAMDDLFEQNTLCVQLRSPCALDSEISRKIIVFFNLSETVMFI